MMVLFIQTVSGPPIPPQLRSPKIAAPCSIEDDSGDIVVCAQNDTDYRLDTLPDHAAKRPDPLSFRLPGGGGGNIHAFQNDLPGATSQGMAVTIKIPFGRKAKKPE